MAKGANSAADARNHRRSFRFSLVTPVDVARGITRYAHGNTLDISRDGAAIKVLPFLKFNEDYEFFFHGFGRFKGTVVRRFDNYCFGIRFNIDEESKKRLDRMISKALGMSDEGEAMRKTRHRE